MSLPVGGRRDVPIEEARAALQNHFSTYQGPNYAEGWAQLWSKGDFLPWDRGNPSPALADTLTNYTDVIGHAMIEEDGKARRKRALVPGCGRGVDVLLLQSFGYDAIGLEYAADALKACEEYQKDHEKDYPVKDEKVGRGSARFVQGDFYADEWLEKAGLSKDTKFDLIYDYTVSCVGVWLAKFDWFATRMSAAHIYFLVFLRDATTHETSLGPEDVTTSAFRSSS